MPPEAVFQLNEQRTLDNIGLRVKDAPNTSLSAENAILQRISNTRKQLDAKDGDKHDPILKKLILALAAALALNFSFLRSKLQSISQLSDVDEMRSQLKDL